LIFFIWNIVKYEKLTILTTEFKYSLHKD